MSENRVSEYLLKCLKENDEKDMSGRVVFTLRQIGEIFTKFSPYELLEAKYDLRNLLTPTCPGIDYIPKTDYIKKYINDAKDELEARMEKNNENN